MRALGLGFFVMGLLTACGSPPGATTAPSSPDAGGSPADSGGGTAPDGASNGDSGAMGGGVCGASTASTPGAAGGPVTVGTTAGCLLSQSVTSSITLSASTCAVYSAPNGLTVGGPASPVVTIEAGVTVAFGAGTNLDVGGKAGLGGLVVQGTAASPVVLTSAASTPRAGDWGGVNLESQTIASTNVAGVIVEYAGGAVSSQYGAGQGAIVVDGTNGDFTATLSNVTTSKNGSTGFRFVGTQTGPSAASSGTLVVTDWPTSGDPFVADPDAAGLLAPVTLVTCGQTPGWVHLFSATTNGHNPLVDIAQTWPSIAPLSYIIGKGNETDDEVFNINGAGSGVTLTIAAPNKVLFGGNWHVYVDQQTSGLAALVAKGTPSAPIVFGSIAANAQPGAWQGIEFDYDGPGLASVLENVTIDAAGELFPTSPGPLGAIVTQGTDNFACVPGPTLTGVTFTNLPSGSYGILAEDVTPATVTTYESANTFPSSMTVYSQANQCH